MRGFEEPNMAHWLVTWESTRAEESGLIAAVFDSRKSAASVASAMEIIYASRYFTPIEWHSWARTKKRPYPAAFDSLGGVPWQGRITCGHNPHLFARLVDKLSFPGDGGFPTWHERPRPGTDDLG